MPKAGSDRIYKRVTLHNGHSVIACSNSNTGENETYFYFTDVLQEAGIRVPQLLAIDPTRSCYIVEDLGDQNLLDRVVQYGFDQETLALYKLALEQLVKMQVDAHKKIDYAKCLAAPVFDHHAVMSDLNYFRYYFADLHALIYNKYELQLEFETLADSIGSMEPVGFMFRDFQGRNIMIHEGKPCFIDFQGGMKGPLVYDLASLLWQAKAGMPAMIRSELFMHYKDELKKSISFDETRLHHSYQQVVLLRLLQVLGAYGLRGLIQQRTHFINSIPGALHHLKEWLYEYGTSIAAYPQLQGILTEICAPAFIEKYEIKRAQPGSRLRVLVQSFSYKNGVPPDEVGNGGGFVFDCRGLLNPGRFEEYKKQTGRDTGVIGFLEEKTRISEFLAAVKKVVDISVEDYLARDFENLMISFGCTGGQHRSVYCTDMLSKHLKEKYGVDVQTRHLVQDAKNWQN